MIQKGIIDLGWGGRVGEGGEMRGRLRSDSFLDSLNGAGAGRGQQRPPMGCFSGFNSSEVTVFRELGGGKISREDRGASLPCCRVELFPE